MQTRTAWRSGAPRSFRASAPARSALATRCRSGSCLTAPATPTLLRPHWRLSLGGRLTTHVLGGPVQVFCDPGSGIEHKILAGYQGWFSCPNDGAPPGYWIHWFNGIAPDARHARSTSGPTPPS